MADKNINVKEDAPSLFRKFVDAAFDRPARLDEATGKILPPQKGFLGTIGLGMQNYSRAVNNMDPVGDPREAAYQQWLSKQYGGVGGGITLPDGTRIDLPSQGGMQQGKPQVINSETAAVKAPKNDMDMTVDEPIPGTSMDVTSITKNGVKIDETPQSKAELDIWTNWNKEITKNKKVASENFNALKGLQQMTIGQWKAAAQEKNEKEIPKGLPQKVMSGVADFMELEGYPQTKAYIGAKVEYAVNAVKLISGGSRIPRDLFNQIVKTLPTDTGITEDAYAKSRQSFESSFKRAIGRELNKDELGVLNNQFESLWNDTPAASLPGSITGSQTKKIRVPDGRVLNVPQEAIPALMKDFEWIEEVQ